MVLPPIEGTPTVVMRFTAQASPQLITLAAQRLREGGGLVVLSQTTLPVTGATLLVLTTSQERLEAQAERLHFMKRSNISSSASDGQQASVVDYFTVARRRAFVRSSQKQHDGYDADGLFTAQDRAFLTTRLLKQVTVVDDTDSTTTTTLAQLLETAYQAKYRKPGHLTDKHNNNTSDDTTTRRMQEHGAQSETLWHVLTTLDWVDTVCAVHQPDLRDRVVAETTLAPWRQLAPPVDLIHDYVGGLLCCCARRAHLCVCACANHFRRCDSDMSRSISFAVWLRSRLLLCLDGIFDPVVPLSRLPGTRGVFISSLPGRRH